MGFLSMTQVYRLQAAHEYLKALITGSHSLHDELHCQENIAVRLKRVIPWTQTARDVLEDVAPVEVVISDPWIVFNDKSVVVDVVSDWTWHEPESRGFNILIGTDGLIRGNITAWGGAVWQNNRKILEQCAGKHGCTRAESEAYEDALIWIESNATEKEKVIILTDSLSLVNRLQSGHVKES